jgi:hypothetical protein
VSKEKWKIGSLVADHPDGVKSAKSYYRVMLGQKSVYAAECFAGNFTGTDFGIDQGLTSVFPLSPRPPSGVATVLVAFRRVLVVPPEPLDHFMYAEGLPCVVL